MTFLSTPIAVVVMLLLPVIEVLIPSFGGKMTVKELLYVGKFLVQTIWVECFQFWNPKVFRLGKTHSVGNEFSVSSQLRLCYGVLIKKTYYLILKCWFSLHPSESYDLNFENVWKLELDLYNNYPFCAYLIKGNLIFTNMV